jgi:Electron transfer DM13
MVSKKITETKTKKVMKTIIAFALAFFMIACQSEDATPVTPIGGDKPDLTNDTLLKSGMFTGIGGHTASGTAKVYGLNGKYYIVFDPYSSQNGPDLKVYLSKDENASAYIRVGKLMATMGKQTYEVPGSPDLAEYPFVHIWCEAFSVEFARAPLQ